MGDLPRGWWQAYMWFASATLMTLAHHGFRGGHVSALVGCWFAGCSALYALTFLGGLWDQRHDKFMAEHSDFFP